MKSNETGQADVSETDWEGQRIAYFEHLIDLSSRLSAQGQTETAFLVLRAALTMADVPDEFHQVRRIAHERSTSKVTLYERSDLIPAYEELAVEAVDLASRSGVLWVT